MSTTADRVETLDLIRGVAVLGILAVNIAAFAGPMIATQSPHVPARGSAADEAMFMVIELLFVGKMRMLFSLLFGASMMLFIDRMEAAGRHGTTLQARRLGWLALFGIAHYLLFWWGDILFAYAAIGFVALAMSRLPARHKAVIGAIIFAGFVLSGSVATYPDAQTAMAISDGMATAAQQREHATAVVKILKEANAEIALGQQGIVPQLIDRVVNKPFWQVNMALFNAWELLPMMLFGMALQSSGFFAGLWPRDKLKRLALVGIAAGLIASLPALYWAWRYQYPADKVWLVGLWSALPRLITALGYAAALVLAAPRLLATWLGERLAAAGRMAFSNYLGTTMLMTAIFQGWGMGLIGKVPELYQPLFVLLGWGLMLAWSKPWLARFRQGPLEWLWRSLVEGRRLSLARNRT